MNNTTDLCTRLREGGWKPLRGAGRFMALAGPLWAAREGDGWAYGVVSTDDHLNPAGVVHGGLLATLIDHALSTLAWDAIGRTPCVTVQLDTHFLAPVAEGQFAEVRVKVNSRSRSLMFLYGEMVVNGTLSATAQAVMKIMAAART